MVLWNHIVANHLELVGMEYGNIRGRTASGASHVTISTLPDKVVDHAVLESERQLFFSSTSWSHNFLSV
jgi:hypothetical protein